MESIPSQGERCSRGEDSATIWSLVAASTLGWRASSLAASSRERNCWTSRTVGATLIWASAASLLPLWTRAATLVAQTL